MASVAESPELGVWLELFVLFGVEFASGVILARVLVSTGGLSLLI